MATKNDDFESSSDEEFSEDSHSEELNYEDENSEELNYEDENSEELNEDSHSEDQSPNDSHPISLETVIATQEAIAQSGVVYISRIPPFMKPIKLRHLLSSHGQLGRLYMAPEDQKITARRKKYGGNKKQCFTEAWVEFTDKRRAKRAATLLNGQSMGGKKRDFFANDVWNIKYLHKFKWHHLTERIAYEKAVREQRLRAELQHAKRENQMYLKNVEKAKMVAGIREKRLKKMENNKENNKENVSDAIEGARRQFRQRKVVENVSNNATPSVLSRLFK